MDETKTITINDAEYNLRKWPALPGWKFTRAITRALADLYAGLNIDLATIKEVMSGGSSFTVDPAMIDKVMSDANMDQCISMIGEGLEFKSVKEGREFAAKLAFEDFFAVLTAVLIHNLSFLPAHVKGLLATMTPSAISTQPEVVSRDSAVAPSIKS